ncbi:MAG: hypothetical protein D6706_15610 [Chloroflexi bacterium]|nr:MAG: hypothetical protein D6706_15610 [Chloroflexota bacterium]
MPPQNTDIAGQSVRGSLYSIIASGFTITLGFLRAILLARLLLPEYFGVVAMALFFLELTNTLSSLGLDSAIIHRRDADQTWLGTYFSLRLLFKFLPLAGLILLTPLITDFYPNMPLLAPVIWGYAIIEVVKTLNATQETILNRDLAFRQLAITDVAASIAMTIVAPALAWAGWGIWALVAERAVGNLVRFIAVWLFFRRWLPKPHWNSHQVRWFWSFATRIWLASTLTFFLDRFDDFWTGTALGKSPLGFYSKAYEFARYPRRLVANPIITVFFPIFARLQAEPIRLARAFFRMNSVMVRFGFWFGLIFVMNARELIVLLIGEQWLPMLIPFQLMVIYTLLDPLSVGATRFVVSVGQPATVTKIRAVQACVFLPSVIGLAWLWGVVGVALAADLMVLTGVVLLFVATRRIITYSLRALFFWPLVAVGVSAVLLIIATPLWTTWPLWLALVAKAGSSTLVYGVILWLTERKQLQEGWYMIWGLLRREGKAK